MTVVALLLWIMAVTAPRAPNGVDVRADSTLLILSPPPGAALTSSVMP